LWQENLNPGKAMRYILIHAEDSPAWGEDFIRYAQAAVIRHRFNLGDFELTDKQKMTLSRYLNPPKPVSVVEFDSDGDATAWVVAQTVSDGGPMELFQV
jgi:hypothetical protein